MSLYRRADVGLVTPVRDGMNLVAQEMVLCQDAIEGLAGEYRGALVLSEYAGVAQYLSRALLVNPWDIERTADALERALRMSAGEKRERLRTMIAQVDEMDSRRWADLFLLQVARSAQRSRARAQRNLRARDLDTLCGRFEAARGRILILDYDGTLREITREPEEAEPTDEIRALLSGLAALRGCEVHVVSGRDRATLDAWLDDLRIWLCAEHGYCSRPPAGAWEVRHDVELSWKPAVARMLGSAAAEVPGTRVESKSCALAWHYRMADLDYGAWRARELCATLSAALADQPVEVIPGNRVIEVRAAGIHKGTYVRALLDSHPADAFVLCAGDDSTDLDMYRVLPEHAVCLHVGAAGAGRGFTLESPARMREVLQALLATAGASGRGS